MTGLSLLILVGSHDSTVLGVAQQTVSDWLAGNRSDTGAGKPSKPKAKAKPRRRSKVPRESYPEITERVESGETQEVSTDRLT